jgi:lysozyme family protein
VKICGLYAASSLAPGLKKMTDLSASKDLSTLKAANLARWHKMVIHQSFLPAFNHVAAKLLESKTRYQTVDAKTKVPWAVIAVIHERESSQSWAANLAQSDPWNKRSIHVPRGRGPFKSWEDAAIDALVNCPPLTARNTDWSVGGALVALEEYNGLGYEQVHHIASPYLWSGTDQYLKGKYVADGHFDPEAVDHQLGCAGLLSRLQAEDSSAAFKEVLEV